MNKRHGLFLKTLLNRTAEKSQIPLAPAFFKSVPQEMADAALSQTTTSTDLTSLVRYKSDIFEKWHYSWIFQMMEPLDPKAKEAVLLLVKGANKKKLADLFKIPIRNLEWPPLLKKFAEAEIISLVNYDPVTPIAYLPESRFNQLLEQPKEHLVKMIDFLGLYDLAHEIKHIVGKKTLTDIYSCLTQEQQLFLRQCLHAKDQVMTPKLYLETWNGDKKTLIQLLHRRGIARLAIALSGQHPDLIWHLAHALDIGRGTLLMKQVQSEKIGALSDAVILQLETVQNNLLKKESP